MFTYNNSKHSSTKYLQFFFNYGFHPHSFHIVSKSNNKAANTDVKKIQKIHQKISNNLTKAISDYKDTADKKRNESDFRVGNYVCLNSKNIKLNLPALGNLVPSF